MRRGTWLVIGALAAIALAAAVDSLRGEATEPASGPGTTTTGRTATDALPADAEPARQPAGFDGILYYTDESCELRAVRLPALDPVEAETWDECSFVLSPDGTRVSAQGSAWDPHSDPRRGRVVRTDGATFQVANNAGPEGPPVAGTAPAWKPDGTLTYVDGAAVREWPTGGLVLSQRDLAVAVRAHPGIADSGHVRRTTVEDLEWLDDARLVVALSVPVEDSIEHLVAVFAGRRPDFVNFAGPDPLLDIRTSPGGRFFAVRRGSAFVLFDSRRGPLELPPPVGADLHAVAWAPDGLSVAAATSTSVYLFRPGAGGPIREHEIAASDLAWHGSAAPPEIAEADEARDWLAGVRATGRLFVTEPGCRLRALRLPDLEWEDEPAGEPAPCRFALDIRDEPVAEEISLAPGGELRATCRDGGLAVFGAAGPTTEIPDACAPAWMPDGTLTFVRDGELWQGTVEPRRVITRAELRDMFGREAALQEVAWFDDERVWAVVRVGSSLTIAAMTDERLVYSPTFTAQRIEGLQASPTGMVAARTDGGIVFFESGGRRALSFPGAKAVTWAPGNLVAVVAAPRQILLVAPVSREVVPLPLAVEDLEWVVP
jgi:WD40-like Beta Propeller Repeat